MPMIERPNAFNDVLLEFLAETGPAEEQRAGRPREPAASRLVDRALRRRADVAGVLAEHAGLVARRPAARRRPRARRSRPSDSSTLSSRPSTSKTIVSPSRTAAIGPPRGASGATWPAMKPWVAPEKRPSVSSATESPSPSPTSAAVTCEHLAHAGAAGGALVADHHDVAGLDRLALDRGEGVLLGLEHARRAAVLAAVVAGELDHAALGREVAAQDREAAVGLERVVDSGRITSWPSASSAASATSPIVRAGHGERVLVQQRRPP